MMQPHHSFQRFSGRDFATWLTGLLVVAFAAAACSDDQRSGQEDVRVVEIQDDLTLADGVLTDATVDSPTDSSADIEADTNFADTNPVDTTPDVEIAPLPTCVQACDRLVECAQGRCIGITWQTVGLLWSACNDACTDSSAAALLDAATCDQVYAQGVVLLPNLDTACNSDVCELACGHLADCVIDECPLVNPPARAGIVSDCQTNCDNGAVDLLGASCTEVITMASQNPQFEAICYGGACAPAQQCVAYGDKTSQCIVQNCAGNADAYQTGLAEALAIYCQTEPDCPPASGVQAVLDPAITCADPMLAGLGTQAPFVDLCSGNLGVAAADLRTACEALAGCNLEIGTVDTCMVYLAMSGAAAAVQACIANGSTCGDRAACLGP